MPQLKNLVAGMRGRECVPDTDVYDRLRKRLEPVFLKPLGGRDFLPSLLTILHSIPQCRRALLSPDHTLSDYGANEHWWEGETIETTRITDTPGETVRDMHLELLHETQRLMAFLSTSSRSYGSAGAIVSMPAMKLCDDQMMFSRFLRSWDRAAYETAALDDTRTMFHSELERTDGNDPVEPVYLEVEMRNTSTNLNPTVYDALDQDVWGTGEEPLLFKRTAPVLTMFVKKAAPLASMRVEKYWYADRYMMHNAEAVAELRTKRSAMQRRLHDIDGNLQRLQTLSHPSDGSKKVDSAKLLSTTISFIQSRDDQHDTGIKACFFWFSHPLTFRQNSSINSGASPSASMSA